MKFLIIFMTALATVFLVNCSTHPEIKPYEESSEATTEELPSGHATADSVFAEALDSEDSMPTEFDDKVDMAEQETSVEEKVAEKTILPVKKEVAAPKADRGLASVGKSGMFTFKADCVMRSKPDDSSENVGHVSAGKKLWLDTHDNVWFKAYKKTGTVFISSTCIQ